VKIYPYVYPVRNQTYPIESLSVSLCLRCMVSRELLCCQIAARKPSQKVKFGEGDLRRNLLSLPLCTFIPSPFADSGLEMGGLG